MTKRPVVRNIVGVRPKKTELEQELPAGPQYTFFEAQEMANARGQPISEPFLPILERAYEIGMAQYGWEIIEAVEEVKKIDPKIIVEIGVWRGGTLHVWSQCFPDAVVIGIDNGAEGYGKAVIDTIPRGKNVSLIGGNSHEVETLQKLETVLSGKLIDFLFIDGDHSMEGARKDFEMYSKLIRKGGINAYHDICKKQPLDWIKVRPFWEDVLKTYKTKEIVDHDVVLNGIGIIYWDGPR